MSRRKGERPLPQFLDRWLPDHVVAQSIKSGSTWLGAWQRQKALPLATLVRKIGLSMQRLLAIDGGDHVSRAEIDALAIAWSVSAGDLIASMPDPSIVID